MDANDLPLSLRIASGWYVSLNRYAKKRDIAERPIIEALERAGCEVWVLDKPVDLAVRRNCWPPGMVMLMEVKTGNEKVREGVQADAVASAGCAVVRTPLEAVNAVWNVKYAEPVREVTAAALGSSERG